MILCSAEPRIISCLPTHVINLVINDNSLEIIYIYIYIYMCVCVGGGGVSVCVCASDQMTIPRTFFR